MAEDQTHAAELFQNELADKHQFDIGGQKSVPLIRMSTQDFARKYEVLIDFSDESYGRANHIESAIATLREIAGQSNEADESADRILRNKLSHTVSVLYRMFGKPYVLDMIANLFRDAMQRAVHTGEVDTQNELQKFAGFMLEQLQHEVDKNVITREQFYREILVGNLLYRPDSDRDVLVALIGEELDELYRKDILYRFYMEKAVDPVAAKVHLEKRIDTEIMPRIQLDDVDKKYPLSVFEFLQEIIQMGPIELQNLPHSMPLESQEEFLNKVIDENSERLLHEEPMKVFLEDIRRLVMTALQHRKGAGLEKNVLVLFSVADIFLKKIAEATFVQKHTYPDFYLHLDYIESRDRRTYGNVSIDMDAWNATDSPGKAPNTKPTLLKEVQKKELDAHAELQKQEKSVGEYSLRYQDIFMRYLLRSVVSTLVRAHYEVSRVELPTRSEFLSSAVK